MSSRNPYSGSKALWCCELHRTAEFYVNGFEYGFMV